MAAMTSREQPGEPGSAPAIIRWMSRLLGWWQRHPYLSLAVLLYLLLVGNSAHFFFHEPFYELGDWAADSFSIDRAKHFAEFYGNYSRFGFHHPGPFFFYLQALGEWLFYDRLGLVAAPYNGQVLIHGMLTVGLLVVVLRICARSVSDTHRGWFVAGALGVGACHLAAIGWLEPDMRDNLIVPSAIWSIWSAHALTIPFLCLLAAGASVAAGNGDDLPWLALAGGLLVHLHVAQPLFVGPLSLLAYGGLWRNCRARNARPWQESPRAHAIAAMLVILFATPIVLDLLRGQQSNFAAIFHHLRTHRGERHPLGDSLVYLLLFGAYTAYQPHFNAFDLHDAAGLHAYFSAHAWLYVLWSAVLVTALVPLGRALVRKRVPADAAPNPGDFLAWGGGFLLTAIALTLYWGTIQDDRLAYYNAWFDFAIYYFALLLALATLCGLARRALPDSGLPAVRAGLFAAVVTIFLLLADQLYVADPHRVSGEEMRQTVAAAMGPANDSKAAPPLERFIAFSQEAWPLAVGVALQLHRSGLPVLVAPNRETMFGAEYVDRPTDPAPTQLWRVDSDAGLRARVAADAAGGIVPLWKAVASLAVAVPHLTLAGAPQGATLDFRVGGNALPYELFGWSGAETWGTWNDGHRVALIFHPDPEVSQAVTVTLRPVPVLAPARGLKAQRLRLYFAGQPIAGPAAVSAPDRPVTFRIPAEQWNRAVHFPADTGARMEWEFPDAIAPAELDGSGIHGDRRLLGVGFVDLHFELEAAAPPGPAGS